MIDTFLLDGLWQGALVAAVAALVTVLLPQRHAATRYAVWFAALLTLVMLPVVSQWHPAPAIATLPAPVANTAKATALVTARAAGASGAWLLSVWLAGVLFGLARLVRSYVRIGRIVRRATPSPELGHRVMTSADIPIPIAAGLFTPVVIIPAPLVNVLERGDLERIVQHERAHIRRGDIAANLVQRLIEAGLFFNPWVYLIGRQLVKERESACDDWAVHATGDPDRYASCLAEVAQGAARQRTPLLTPSAIGSKRILLKRIARLLNGKASQLKTNYFVLSASVAVFALLAFALQMRWGLAAPATTVALACGADVKILNPVPPDIARADYRYNVWASALVTVAPDGHVISVKIVKSSGSAAIDRDVVKAAWSSTYSPAMSACKAVTSQYLFKARTGSPGA
ncbi:MAG TPA: M56 family metallopeptidase [Candidatus Baltobacteraceae bacterium]|nr:M56 family metallopeptidase [Candidatus Baltobacteraceae bacterium]